jgi:hypothetical protein
MTKMCDFELRALLESEKARSKSKASMMLLLGTGQKCLFSTPLKKAKAGENTNNQQHLNPRRRTWISPPLSPPM